MLHTFVVPMCTSMFNLQRVRTMVPTCTSSTKDKSIDVVPWVYVQSEMVGLGFCFKASRLSTRALFFCFKMGFYEI
jgi:hypothetical protein